MWAVVPVGQAAPPACVKMECEPPLPLQTAAEIDRGRGRVGFHSLFTRAWHVVLIVQTERLRLWEVQVTRNKCSPDEKPFYKVQWFHDLTSF